MRSTARCFEQLSSSLSTEEQEAKEERRSEIDVLLMFVACLAEKEDIERTDCGREGTVLADQAPFLYAC